jgi:hypothetical protein
MSRFGNCIFIEIGAAVLLTQCTCDLVIFLAKILSWVIQLNEFLILVGTLESSGSKGQGGASLNEGGHRPSWQFSPITRAIAH